MNKSNYKVVAICKKCSKELTIHIERVIQEKDKRLFQCNIVHKWYVEGNWDHGLCLACHADLQKLFKKHLDEEHKFYKTNSHISLGSKDE